MSNSKKIWVKAETYDGERRVLLTPDDAKQLIEAGAEISVERSDARIFPDNVYEAAGCKLVEPNTWNTEAAKDSIVLGVKYLDRVDRLNPDFPIKDRTLIHWAHSFDFDPDEQLEIARLEETSINVPVLHGKPYINSPITMHSPEGYAHNLQGIHAKHRTNLLDLEVLRHPNGDRVMDGYNAGLCGAATSLYIWLNKREDRDLKEIPAPFDTRDLLAADLRERLEKIPREEWPSCAVIGAEGRAGQGAKWLFDQLNLPQKDFNRDGTCDKASFSKEIVNHEIVINCISLGKEECILINNETLENNRKISIITDVSSYAKMGALRFPEYTWQCYWSNPTIRVKGGEDPVDLVAIDNLPNLLAKPVSTAISAMLTGKLLELFEKQEQGAHLSDFFLYPETISQKHIDLAASVKDLAFSISANCFGEGGFQKTTAVSMLVDWLRQNPLTPAEQKLFKGYFRTGFAQVYDLRSGQFDHSPRGGENTARARLAKLDDFTDKLDIAAVAEKAKAIHCSRKAATAIVREMSRPAFSPSMNS